MNTEHTQPTQDTTKLKHLSDVLRRGHKPNIITGIYLTLTQVIALGGVIALWSIPDSLSFGAVALYLLLHLMIAIFSITAYAHRLVSHKATERISPLIHLSLGYVGQTLAVQGSLASWAGHHRAHHAVDAHQRYEEDPYSAIWFSNTWLNFLWSHMLCYYFINPHQESVYEDRITTVLRQNPIMRLQHRFYPIFLVLIVYLMPCLLGCFLSGSLNGGLFLMWMSVLASVIVQHITWSVNSFTHLWGQEAARSSAKNNFFWLLPMGEGNHHADHHDAPTDFRNGFGLLGWLLDPTRYVLILLRAIKLVGPLRKASLSLEIRVIAERKILTVRARLQKKSSELWVQYEERLNELKTELCSRAKHFENLKREKKALLKSRSQHTQEQLRKLLIDLQYQLDLARLEFRHTYQQFKLEVRQASKQVIA